MSLTENDIIEQLNKLCSFLEPVHSLADFHLGSFFLENTWNKHVPSAIQSELNNLSSIENFIQSYPKIIRNECPNEFAVAHPHLLKFINTATSISITREEKYSKLLQDLENLFLTKNCSNERDVEITEFMSPKKFHEVKVTSKFTGFVSKITESSHVVDIGGGKGYLSCILALHYSFKVLGLDSSEVTTCGAVKVSEKIAKMWNSGILKPSGDIKCEEEVNNKKVREEFVQKHYKQIITFVNPDTDVEGLLRESFNEEITGITLTGLHTCGNLASSCLKMFLNKDKVKGILNVGCCYNHLTEEFNTDHSEKNEGESYGFPLSKFLRTKKCALGRNARMLAAHSLERINSDSEFEFSQTSLFYRAVLETVMKNLNPSTDQRHVGRLAKKCDSFQDYMFTALKKLEIPVQLTSDDLDELYEGFAHQKPYLTAFYLLRISLAPVVESIILLDRILYLIENGIKNAYLVPLFNLEISPRGFGIIAWKDVDGLLGDHSKHILNETNSELELKFTTYEKYCNRNTNYTIDGMASNCPEDTRREP